jgi:hypothetical protein
MKRAATKDFPELRRVFSGYLHEDFREDFNSPGAALQAFHDDANASERRKFQTEARKFVEYIDALDLKEIRGLLAQLGCRWSPPSRGAVVALLTQAAKR